MEPEAYNNSTTGLIQKLQNLSSTASEAKMSEQNLREISKEFEAALTSALLKEQLKSAFSMNTDSQVSGGDTYTNFASEQIAHYLGQQQMLGISDMIQEKLKNAQTMR